MTIEISRRGAVGLVLASPAIARAQGVARPPIVLTAVRQTVKLLGAGAPETEVFGFEGLDGEGAVRFRQGEPATLRIINRLDEAFGITIRGLRGPEPFGPGPEPALIQSGETREAVINTRDAGTMLIRAMAPERSHVLAAQGLSAVMIVEERAPYPVDRDLALALHFWTVHAGGRLAAPGPDTSRIATTNRVAPADLVVRPNDRLRLRLVNTTASEVVGLQLPPVGDVACHALALWSQPAEITALHGDPAQPALATPLAGDRTDMIVDIRAAAGSTLPLIVRDLMRGADPAGTTERAIRVEGEPIRPAPLARPAELPANTVSAAMPFRNAFRRDLTVSAGADGAPRLAERADRRASPEPLFRVRRGTTVMLAIRNQVAGIFIVGLHGHAARLLDGLDDGWKPFFTDNLLLGPQLTQRIAFAAETPGRFLMTLTSFGTDAGPLVAWFEVT